MRINSHITVSRETLGVNIRTILNNFFYFKKDMTGVTNFQLDKTFAILPRNLDKIYKLAPHLRNEEIVYDTVLDTLEHINTVTNFRLKPLQKKALDEVLQVLDKKHNCILQADCGWGKSYTLGATIAALKQRTLILADRSVLVEQLHKELSANLEADVKVISKKCKEISDVNICTLQFLRRNPDVLRQLIQCIGFVVLDECHIAPADSFAKIIQQFPAHYRLGLSATPTRSDGLDELLTDIFGSDKIIGKQEVVEFSAFAVESDKFFYVSADKFLIDIAKAYRDEYVTDFIRDVTVFCKSVGRVVFIASDNQENQTLYKDILEENGLRVAIINAKTSSKQRQEIFTQCENNQLDVLIGFGVMEKGVSIKRLDTLIVAVTAITKEKLQQIVGRLFRDHEDAKKPIVIDVNVRGSGTTWNAKIKWYKSAKGCTFNYIHGFNTFRERLKK